MAVGPAAAVAAAASGLAVAGSPLSAVAAVLDNSQQLCRFHGLVRLSEQSAPLPNELTAFWSHDASASNTSQSQSVTGALSHR